MDEQKGQAEAVKSIELFDKEVPYQVLKLVSKEAAERYKMVVFEKNDVALKVAMVNPNDGDAINAIHFIAGQKGVNLEIYKTSEESFQHVFEGYDKPDVVIGKAVSDYVKKEKEIAVEREKKRQLKARSKLDTSQLGSAPVEKVVDVMLEHAILGGASDVHVEPQEKELRIRYRVDGDLFESFKMAKEIGPAIVSRVKIMSNLKIDEKRKPQDGRLMVEHEGRSVDVRVSTLPTAEGEKVVMRILEKQSGLDKFENLGLRGRCLDIMNSAIEEPYGIILITGPTGSGKSTTIYTALRKMNKIDRNIVTLEDPVEYKVPGVNHSQVRPEIGFSFASGLRSVLRQDPDIIMVGEIRDGETAELATHAALTGHLVLSTLHTNDALGAIPRLVDMGIEPFLLSSSLTISAAQRLVRRLCDNCKKQVEPSQRIKEYILNSLKLIPDEEKKRRIPDFDPNHIKIWEAKGCPKCKNLGTKGRIAIYEVVSITTEMKKVIDDDLTAAALKKEFVRQGGYLMREDGVLKAITGDVSVEEVEEATKEDELGIIKEEKENHSTENSNVQNTDADAQDADAQNGDAKNININAK